MKCRWLLIHNVEVLNLGEVIFERPANVLK